MNEAEIIKQLHANLPVFQNLFNGIDQPQQIWKPEPGRWSLLEVICHLCDEEKEDFRARIQHTLETPHLPLPSIDPTGWVTQRHYAECNYEQKLDEFISLRISNLVWLNSLENAPWHRFIVHPKFGNMSAGYFLVNWLAHDYLHFRQIIHLKFQYLKQMSGTKTDYAGNW